MTDTGTRYWLLKTEPEVFSLDDLQRRGVEPWEGVRNYEARNHLRAMSPGDIALIYHSSCQPAGIVGLGTIAGAHRPDPAQFDPQSPYFDPKSSETNIRWSLVDVAYQSHWPRMVTLEQIRQTPDLAQMALVCRPRLSVMPISPEEFELLRGMAHA